MLEKLYKEEADKGDMDFIEIDDKEFSRHDKIDSSQNKKGFQA